MGVEYGVFLVCQVIQLAAGSTEDAVVCSVAAAVSVGMLLGAAAELLVLLPQAVRPKIIAPARSPASHFVCFM